ncbi:phosphatase PAP2 family protein [Zobellella maritima]|uniref:phosphatase PAP2 family protein n=1 Tax=Zobellella maritima TaxID=2059725 RepID=UPI000E30AA8B|nr:phosphatase PAP2 family protein [Zobellella maritima]
MRLDTLTSWDHRLFQKSQSHGYWRQCACLSRWISRTGDGPPYAVLGLILWFSNLPHLQGYVVDALMAFALELPCYLAIKNICRRPRPAAAIAGCQAYIHPSDRFSLPSGHTAAAFLMAVLAVGHLGIVGLLTLPWALMVGLSRVLLGVHFPGDILAGAALGGGIACFVLWF